MAEGAETKSGWISCDSELAATRTANKRKKNVFKLVCDLKINAEQEANQVEGDEDNGYEGDTDEDYQPHSETYKHAYRYDTDEKPEVWKCPNSDPEMLNEVGLNEYFGAFEINEQTQTHAFEDDPFSSRETMKEFVSNSLQTYVSESVTDLMLNIMTTRNIENVPDLVECLLELPLEFDPMTMTTARSLVLDSICNNLEKRAKIAAFFKAVQAHQFSMELMNDFTSFALRVFQKNTETDEEERQSIIRLKMEKSKLLVFGKTPKLREMIEALQTKNYNRIIKVSWLLIELYQCNCFKSNKMLKILLTLSTKSDYISMYLLVRFMKIIGNALEKDINVSQIYSKLETLGKSTPTPEIPSDLIRKARLIGLRKKSEICNEKRVMECRYELQKEELIECKKLKNDTSDREGISKRSFLQEETAVDVIQEFLNSIQNIVSTNM